MCCLSYHCCYSLRVARPLWFVAFVCCVLCIVCWLVVCQLLFDVCCVLFVVRKCCFCVLFVAVVCCVLRVVCLLVVDCCAVDFSGQCLMRFACLFFFVIAFWSVFRVVGCCLLFAISCASWFVVCWLIVCVECSVLLMGCVIVVVGCWSCVVLCCVLVVACCVLVVGCSC